MKRERKKPDKKARRYSASNSKMRVREQRSKSGVRAVKETILLGAFSLANSVESFGQKLLKSGYRTFGAKVEKVADMIEYIGLLNSKKSFKQRIL